MLAVMEWQRREGQTILSHLKHQEECIRNGEKTTLREIKILVFFI